LKELEIYFNVWEGQIYEIFVELTKGMNDVKRITLAGPFMIDEGCYYRGFEDIMTSWDTF